MSRLSIPTRDQLPVSTHERLEGVYRQFGRVPAVFRLLASNPAVLDGYLALSASLTGILDLKTRMRIAIAVSEANGCDYCLSANAYVALNVGRLTPEEIALNRQGGSSDRKADAAVRFAAEIAASRGRVSNHDLAAIREAGFSDQDIVAIGAVVGQCSFANLLNQVAQTDIDFPALHAGSQCPG